MVQAILSIRIMVKSMGLEFLIAFNMIPLSYLLKGWVLVQLVIGLTLFPIFDYISQFPISSGRSPIEPAPICV